MATFLAIFLAIFVFAMTTSGIITAVGTVNTAQYDIEAAAYLLQTIYVKPFGVPAGAAGTVSYVLLALPGVLAFYTFKAIFGRKKR